MVNSQKPEDGDPNFNPYGYLGSSWENVFIAVTRGEQEWADVFGSGYFWGSIIVVDRNDDNDEGKEGVVKQDTDDVDDFDYLGEP